MSLRRQGAYGAQPLSRHRVPIPRRYRLLLEPGTKNVTNVDVKPGYALSDIGPWQYWGGVVTRDDGSYNYAGGGSGSGYKHVIMGMFNNCVVKYGCIAAHYPKVSMYAHYDGTLHYSEEG